MYRIILLAISVTLLYSCQINDYFPEATEGLANGDMETASTVNPNQPEGWRILAQNFNPPNNHRYGRTEQEAYKGTFSMFISTEVITSPDEFWYYRQTVPLPDLQARTPMQFSVAVKTTGLFGNGFVIRIVGWDRQNPIQNVFYTSIADYATNTVEGNTDWRVYYMNLPEMSPTIQEFSVDLILSPNTTGTVYFDEAQLRYITSDG